MPTGISIGRTLSIVDIVGRRYDDGAHIFAQCKKYDYATAIEPDFPKLCEGLNPTDVAYYFAYGGCVSEVPPRIRVFNREDALHWAKTPKGELCWSLLLKD